ncbi:hypothetical protein [Arthrobacter sp. TMN-50]
MFTLPTDVETLSDANGEDANRRLEALYQVELPHRLPGDYPFDLADLMRLT